MLRFFLVFLGFIFIYGCSSVDENVIAPLNKITEERTDGNYFVQTAFYSIDLKNKENVNEVEKIINDKDNKDSPTQSDGLFEYENFFTTFDNYIKFHHSLKDEFTVVSFYNTAKNDNTINNSLYNTKKYLSSVIVTNGVTKREYSDYETGVNYSFTINQEDKSLTTHVTMTDIDENSKSLILNNESVYYPSQIEKEISHAFSISNHDNNTVYYNYLKDKDNIYIVFYYITN